MDGSSCYHHIEFALQSVVDLVDHLHNWLVLSRVNGSKHNAAPAVALRRRLEAAVVRVKDLNPTALRHEDLNSRVYQSTHPPSPGFAPASSCKRGNLHPGLGAATAIATKGLGRTQEDLPGSSPHRSAGRVCGPGTGGRPSLQPLKDLKGFRQVLRYHPRQPRFPQRHATHACGRRSPGVLPWAKSPGSFPQEHPQIHRRQPRRTVGCNRRASIGCSHNSVRTL